MACQWILFWQNLTFLYFTMEISFLFSSVLFLGSAYHFGEIWGPFEEFFPAPAVENTGGGPMTLHSQVPPTRSARLCTWGAGFSSSSDLLFPCFRQMDYRCAPLSHIPLRALPGMLLCFPPCSCSSSSASSCLWRDCSELEWKLHA